MNGANSNGRQPNNTSYIKTFIDGYPSILWKQIVYNKAFKPDVALTPVTARNVYIPGDLYLNGNLVHTSDRILKTDIEEIDHSVTNKLMNLIVKRFTYKSDPQKKVHYGFIAQEFEEVYNELIEAKPDETYNNVKGINYLEIIPLLVDKVQMMQKEIDELKSKL
jgi:hypothetical protein